MMKFQLCITGGVNYIFKYIMENGKPLFYIVIILHFFCIFYQIGLMSIRDFFQKHKKK